MHYESIDERHFGSITKGRRAHVAKQQPIAGTRAAHRALEVHEPIKRPSRSARETARA